MKFRTEYQAEPQLYPTVEYGAPLLFLGSCFAENIAGRLRKADWSCVSNPYGTLYNPVSIHRTLTLALDNYPSTVEYDPVSRLWFSWDCATRHSRHDRAEAEQAMHEALEQTRVALYSARLLFITFGTARVFRLIRDNGRIVSNCHKQPARLFSCDILEPEQIIEHWQPLLERLNAACPSLEVIFTVSPVRYMADGLSDNTRSKARLLLACERLSQIPHCHYFPAYEIVNDDLRDYRYYASDLVHPSEQAVEYLYEKWIETFMRESDRELLRLGERRYRSSQHRPLHN